MCGHWRILAALLNFFRYLLRSHCSRHLCTQLTWMLVYKEHYFLMRIMLRLCPLQVAICALDALSLLTDGDNAQLQLCIDAGIVPQVCQLLRHPHYQVMVREQGSLYDVACAKPHLYCRSC